MFNRILTVWRKKWCFFLDDKGLFYNFASIIPEMKGHFCWKETK